MNARTVTHTVTRVAASSGSFGSSSSSSAARTFTSGGSGVARTYSAFPQTSKAFRTSSNSPLKYSFKASKVNPSRFSNSDLF